MEDRDYLELCALIAVMAIGMILHARVLKNHAETLVRHDEDITFLRLVTRGLEEKVAE